jgi:hypothetical protein
VELERQAGPVEDPEPGDHPLEAEALGADLLDVDLEHVAGAGAF